jgi:uncharacterized phage protein gp47/JayE
MSTVPQPVFGVNGYSIPDAGSILAAVQNDLNTAFGGGVNPSLSTPQGQWCSSQAAIINNKNIQFLYYVSQVDPLYAQGRMQDAIGYIYFMTRNPAMSTSVVCTCTGLAGTVIPAGAQAKDTNGNIYYAQTGGTIPASGSISLTFLNTVTGPIPCGAGTLNQIYVAIPGWDTITNPAVGSIGTNVETSQQFEFRRQNSVAMNSKGSMSSIYAAVFASGASLPVPSVPTDVYVTENTTSSPLTIGGVTLVPHSVYVAVVGGDDNSIAQAIWSKKDLGCDYNGNTTVVVQDTSGYNPPYPTYNVTFERPAAVPIYFAVSIVNDPSLPAGVTSLIQAAIISAFSGGDGGTAQRIGGHVYASRYYAPVLGIDPHIHVLSLYVGTAPSPVGVSAVININQYPTVAAANISVSLV